MLELISDRIKYIQEQIQKTQHNIDNLSKDLEKEKVLSLQLMGHFNEAMYLHNENKKLALAEPVPLAENT